MQFGFELTAFDTNLSLFDLAKIIQNEQGLWHGFSDPNKIRMRMKLGNVVKLMFVVDATKDADNSRWIELVDDYLHDLVNNF